MVHEAFPRDEICQKWNKVESKKRERSKHTDDKIKPFMQSQSDKLNLFASTLFPP